MLIASGSALTKIPKDLDRRQVFLLEGIVQCAASLDFSMAILVNELEMLSHDKPKEGSENSIFDRGYLIFKEAWNFIDTCTRLASLLEMISIPSPDPKPILENLQKAKGFRNTYQHLDERIEEFMVDANTPVWGGLNWLVIKDYGCKIYSYIYGGRRYGTHSHLINPAGLTIHPPIDHITLEAVQRNEGLSLSTINLSELYQSAGILIEKLEKETEKKVLELKLEEFWDRGTLISLEFVVESPKEKHQD
jgi:hypothetical protein